MKINLQRWVIGFLFIATFSTANAMMLDKAHEKEIEDSMKKISINELRPNDSEREEIINGLINGFFDQLKKDRIYDLKAIRNYHNTGYNFGDEKTNHISLYNWIVYTRSMYALHKLGSQEDCIKLEEEIDRARRMLDMIDFYTDGRDYKSCLSGIWSIVSIFDQKERKDFIDALQKGELVYKDQNLIELFKSF